MRKQKSYKCPACTKKVFLNFGDWASHMEKCHPELIPDGWSPARYMYYLQSGMKVGSCIMCHGETEWNEVTQKYARYCKNPACKQKYVEIAKGRMVAKYGKVHIMNDPEMQRKLLAGRAISGSYKFKDGGKVDYVGTYERDFLEMLDTFDFKSTDIIGPSPHTYYYDYVNPKDVENEGKKFYIPDFFIPSLNLEIEIKTQLNTHHKIQDIDKVKEKLKDDVMASIPGINYIKLNDKDYTDFFKFILDLKDISAKTKAKSSVKAAAMESITMDIDYTRSVSVANESVIDELMTEEEKLSRYDDASLPALENIFKDILIENPDYEISVDKESPMYFMFMKLPVDDSTPDTEWTFAAVSPTLTFNTFYYYTGDSVKFGTMNLIGKGEYPYRVYSQNMPTKLRDMVFAKLASMPKDSDNKIISSGYHLGLKNVLLERICASVLPSDSYDAYTAKCICSGDDIHDYDVKTARRTLAIEQVNADVNAELGIATEAITMDSAKEFWKDKLFPQAFTSGVANTSRYITKNRVIIDTKRDIISIQNINQKLLLNRIASLYEDKKVKALFECMYSKSSVIKFRKKKISRSQMNIVALETPIFFALEVNVLFMELYAEFREPAYLSIAKTIYENTWIKDCDNIGASRLSVESVASRFNKEYTLLDHQKEFIQMYPALKARLNLRGYMLAFDQGLGKTLTAVYLAEALNKDRVFIVAPKSVCGVWRKEIISYLKEYSSNPVKADKEVIDCTSVKSFVGITSTAKYVITNNENIKAFENFLGPKNIALVVDEVHNFRNNKGRRVQELLDMAAKMKVDDILLMSGTPIKAAPAEIVPALRLLDPLCTELAGKIYTECFNLDSTTAMSIVKKRFGMIMYRKTKEILELPKKEFVDLRLPVKDYQQYHISEVNREVTALFEEYYSEELRKNVNLRKQFTDIVERYSSEQGVGLHKYLEWLLTINTLKTINMHEIDKAYVDSFLDNYVTPRIKDAETAKELKVLEKKFIHMKRSCLSRAMGQIYPPYRTKLFKSLFDENIDIICDMIDNNDGKTVIFSQLLPVVKHIEEALNGRDIETVRITGDTQNRMEVIEQFKYDDRVRCLVATSQTLGTGMTLTEANQMLFFGPPWRSADYNQCCDRIHRIGQTRDVTIYNVILDTKEYNLSDRMNKILNWSGEMFDAAIDSDDTESIIVDGALESTTIELDEYDISLEGLLLSKRDGYYNMDKLELKPGKNMLFITGLSGGGKSTLSWEMAEKYTPSVVIELDTLEHNHFLFEWGNDPMPEGHQIIKEWVQKRFGGAKKFSFENDKDIEIFYISLMNLMGYIRDYANSHSDKYFIIEGIQIFEDVKSEIYHEGEPLIIVGSSVIKSTMRRLKREGKNPITYFHDVKVGYRLNKMWDKKLTDFIEKL